VVVLLGTTAAQALLGPTFRVTRQRGQFVKTAEGVWLTATVHPSSVLRAPDEQARADEMAQFVADLQLVADRLADLGDTG
jgi:DNA polymerase